MPLDLPRHAHSSCSLLIDTPRFFSVGARCNHQPRQGSRNYLGRNQLFQRHSFRCRSVRVSICNLSTGFLSCKESDLCVCSNHSLHPNLMAPVTIYSIICSRLMISMSSPSINLWARLLATIRPEFGDFPRVCFSFRELEPASNY